MKKMLGLIKKIVVFAIVALAVIMMVFTVVSAAIFNRNDRDLFGYKAYIVNTDSMAATDFSSGDLIFVKEVDPTTLREGDIITFISQGTESFGETVTHKIRKLTRDVNGNAGFITYGTTTGVDDNTVVTYPYIMGKYVGHLPSIGAFFNFLKTPQGYFTLIFIPFVLLILYHGINCVQLFRRYKGEQLEEMNAEKSRLEEERAENARMMKELLQLKAQLEGHKISPTQEEGDTQDAET